MPSTSKKFRRPSTSEIILARIENSQVTTALWETNPDGWTTQMHIFSRFEYFDQPITRWGIPHQKLGLVMGDLRVSLYYYLPDFDRVVIVTADIKQTHEIQIFADNPTQTALGDKTFPIFPKVFVPSFVPVPWRILPQ